MRSAFAVLFFALKGFFTSRKWLCFCGVLSHFEKGGIYLALAVRFSLGRVLPRRIFSLAEFRVGVICCELCVSLESVLQSMLLNDCCRRAVCALPRCFRGCVLLRMSGLLGDLMNYLLRPIAVVLLSCCSTPCCVCCRRLCWLVWFCPDLLCCCSQLCVLLHTCPAVLPIDSPVPNRFCMTPRFSERFP